MSDAEPSQRVSLHIRLPADLHAQIADEAKGLGVGLNTIIVIALREWRVQKGE